MRQEAVKTRLNREQTRDKWLLANPPDQNGQWECYLQISVHCPRFVTRETLNLEHVKPKNKYPELKHEIGNIRPACQPCNKLKGSFELDELEGRSWRPIDKERMLALRGRLEKSEA